VLEREKENFWVYDAQNSEKPMLDMKFKAGILILRKVTRKIALEKMRLLVAGDDLELQKCFGFDDIKEEKLPAGGRPEPNGHGWW